MPRVISEITQATYKVQGRSPTALNDLGARDHMVKADTTMGGAHKQCAGIPSTGTDTVIDTDINTHVDTNGC